MKPQPGDRVLVAMSGGVDSSVAAAMLKEQGYDVVGCFMRLGSPGDDIAGTTLGHRGCCSISDANDARSVAAKLDIPFYALDFADDFEKIIRYFEDEYHAGRTPNPCVRCNDWLKFGKLHDYAEGIGATWVASGHHARIDHSTGSPRLRRSADHGKDQSYVLFGAGGLPGARPRRLDQMMFPIGDLTKDEVREHAKSLNLGVHSKPDSQEICFVPDDDYAGLLERRHPDRFKQGMMLDADGNELATHEGHQHYTIGQRRRLGVAVGHPLYVIQKDPDSNTVTLGTKDDLAATSCTAGEASWHVDPVHTWHPCRAQVRAHGDQLPARVRSIDDDRIEVEFSSPQEATAAGQAVVCYEGDLVLCGGWIDSVQRCQ
jgi:tRNA-specific 2-thiouridylase